MVLVDTSIWIDYFNSENSKITDLLDKLIEKNLVALSPTIYQEILQGIKNDEHFEQLKYYLLGFKLLDYDAVEAAIGGATIYRKGKKRGFTIRKSNDCLIAWCAIKANIPIFSIDRDFTIIAQFTTLETYN